MNAVDWSPDGALVAVAWSIHEVDLLHVASQKPIITIERDRAIKALKFSPDGLMIAMGGEDKSVSVYDVKTGEVRRSRSRGRGLGRVLLQNNNFQKKLQKHKKL